MRRLGFLLICLAVSIVPASVHADLGGTTISPPLKQVVLSTAGATPVSFSVTNNSAYPQTYQLRAVDFKALSESGGVAFLGQDVTGRKYGLARWLQLPDRQVTLQPRETRTITASIPADIAPGGHYCALLLAAPSQNAQTGKRNLDLHQVTSALVFAIKTGGATYDLDFDRFVGLPNWLAAPPQKVRLRFYNAGNVQAIPRGVVQVIDPRGKVVEQGTINSETGMVLPESYRQYVVPLHRLGTSWVPGTYKVKASYRYEGTDKVETVTSSVFIVNGYVAAACGIVLALLAVVLALFWLRRHKKP